MNLKTKHFDLQENEPEDETHFNNNGLARKHVLTPRQKANLEITNLHEPVLASFNIQNSFPQNH